MSLPRGDVPTDVTSLIPYMTEHRTDWIEVFDRLKGQVGENEALGLTEEAEREIVHGEEIVNLRTSLHRRVAESLELTRKAIADLDRLASGQVFDVEYEGSTAEDLGSLLANVRRDLKAVLALMPTDAKGEMK
ncbi:hypothetical protein [Streptomyces sp. 5-10]|uniref:hypothetical protein n=1 Tax=Streptomyces sp. 5-10 TaxID=878925 RepID=UPI00168C0285|nr:hypothetical protein [Streptomyces sp. 5-10]MBD3004763.1 hypothetical protein [Streptomyces sp. 5-10]